MAGYCLPGHRLAAPGCALTANGEAVWVCWETVGKLLGNDHGLLEDCWGNVVSVLLPVGKLLGNCWETIVACWETVGKLLGNRFGLLGK